LDAPRKFAANRILAGLPAADLDLLAPSLVEVDLPTRKMLEPRGRRIDFVYFLGSGLASMVATGGSNHAIEIAIIGREGMTGLSVLLATERSPHEIFIQSPGAGWRIAAADLRAAMAESAGLRDRLLRYAHTVMVQMGFTALANGRYKLEERLARWLLMAQDRSNGDRVILTHEFLAMMLGTRRPGVTTAISQLEKIGIISSERGQITILDRHALEETANGSYGAAEAEYTRQFGVI
jgi:CRP-like cAMP-binding protein